MSIDNLEGSMNNWKLELNLSVQTMFLGTNLQTSKPIQTLLVSKATNEIFFLSMGCFQSYKKVTMITG